MSSGKDVHGNRPNPGYVPGFSELLILVTMPALVFLRSSFGITLFRPRSIFFVLTYGVGAAWYIALKEPGEWDTYRALGVFAAAAAILYWLHYVFTFAREHRDDAIPDQSPGKSFLLPLSRSRGMSPEASLLATRLVLEPLAVAVFASVLRMAFGERHLSGWLAVVAPGMVVKEAWNWWTSTRHSKMARELKENLPGPSGEGRPVVEPPKATRTAAAKMERRISPEEARERRLAAVLGISEPYELAEAEANYRDRIRAIHPDNNNNSPESNARAAELNEAVEFFRKSLGA